MGSRCGQSLPPRSTGQWLDTILGFAPICFAPLCFVPPLFFPPRSSFAVSGIVSSPHTPQRLYFVRSFVLLLARAPCRFGDFNARQLLFSPLSSLAPLAPLRSPPSVPCLLFRRARASPFPRPRISLANRYFSIRRFSSCTYERCVRDRQLRCDYGATIMHV